MARDSSGSRNQPHYAGTGAPADAADLTEVADYAARLGNRRVDLSSVRASLTGSDLWPGLDFFETDTELLYRNFAAGWRLWQSDWITYFPTVANVNVGSGGGATSTWAYKYVDGDVRIKGGFLLGTSGASVSGIPTISLPVNRVALLHPFETIEGGGVLYDTSVATPYIVGLGADVANVDRVRFYPVNSGVIGSAVGATNPFTWAAGDAASFAFTYRPV